MTDTKASWKRRALKAEHELEAIRRIRSFEHNQEFCLSHINAVLTTAFREIEEVIAWARSSDKTIAR